MAFQLNQHVERLAAYQPFDASFGQLYAEYVDTRQSDQLETRAFDFVSEIIHDPNVRVVVLTGDAGHGKTHLCGRLITSNDQSISDPRNSFGPTETAQQLWSIFRTGVLCTSSRTSASWTEMSLWFASSAPWTHPTG